MHDSPGNVVAKVRVADDLAELEAAVEYALGADAGPERVEQVLAAITRVLGRRGWRVGSDLAVVSDGAHQSRYAHRGR